MIVVGLAVVAVAIATVWFVLVRGSKASAITKKDFDEAYDELVADGERVEGDRAAAWRDFDAWQLRNEEERRSWEVESEE